MTSKLSVAFLILCSVFLAECQNCEYCKGDSCNGDSLSVRSCDEPIESLPYDFVIVENASKKVCLDLTYVEEKIENPVKQCFQTSESSDICEEIRTVLPTGVELKKCAVKNPDLASTVPPVDLATTILTTILLGQGRFPTVEVTNNLVNELTSPKPVITSTKPENTPQPPTQKTTQQPSNLSTQQSTAATQQTTNSVTQQTTIVTQQSANTVTQHTTAAIQQTTNPVTQPTTTLIAQQTSKLTTLRQINEPAHTTIGSPVTVVTTSAPSTSTKDPGGNSNAAAISLLVFSSTLVIQFVL